MRAATKIPILRDHKYTEENIKGLKKVHDWQGFERIFKERNWYLLEESPLYFSSGTKAWDTLYLPFATCIENKKAKFRKIDEVFLVRVSTLWSDNQFTEPQKHYLMSALAHFCRDFVGSITGFVIPT